jgi:hypothetical protein
VKVKVSEGGLRVCLGLGVWNSWKEGFGLSTVGATLDLGQEEGSEDDVDEGDAGEEADEVWGSGRVTLRGPFGAGRVK